jgi:MFS family permease
VVGVGEASYATLAPTIIDDLAPHDQKGKLLAIFYLATPLGSALGFLTGGIIQDAWGWRAAFFVGGGPGIVLAAVVLLIEEPPRALAKVKLHLAEAARKLAKITLYRRAVLGYCAHTAAIGAFSHWAPTFLAEHFAGSFTGGPSEALKQANFWFGTVTVVAGAIGTVIGGRMADRAVRSLPPVPEGSSHLHSANRLAANAQLRICAIGVAIAFPFSAAAFLAPSAAAFFALAGVAEIGLFLSTAPINAIMLRTAPAHMRASAMAIGIFSIHLFGDLWSPALLGLLRDHLEAVIAMMALPLAFAIATAVWWPRAREATEPATGDSDE